MKPNQDNNSKPDATDITNRDDSFVRQQLESLGQPEPIDSQFRKNLSEQLDQAFAATMAEVNVNSETEVAHDDLSTRRQAEETNESLAPGNTNRNNSNRNNTGRRLPRWLGALVAASVLMGMVSFWLGQPSSTWAEMIKALKSTPWVQTDSGRTSSWISSSNQVVARRDAKQTMFVSQSSGASLNYVQGDARIYQTNTGEKWLPLERDLIAWLADSSSGSLQSDVNWSMVSESTRSIDDALGRWLELTVMFESDQSPVRAFSAVFLLNPETKLPVSCRVQQDASTDSSRWRTVSFDYPNAGPTSIFELGVAAGTPIVLASGDSKTGFVRKEEKPIGQVAVLDRRSKKRDGLMQPKLKLKSKSENPSPTETEPTVAEVPVPTPPPVVAPKDKLTPKASTHYASQHNVTKTNRSDRANPCQIGRHDSSSRSVGRTALGG